MNLSNRFTLLINDTELVVPGKSNENSTLPSNLDIGKLAPKDAETFGAVRGELAYSCAYVPALIEPPEGYRNVSIRSLFASLPAAFASLLAHAAHLGRWQSNNRYCSRCGSPNADNEKELAKTCTSCGYMAFPRISPAIIVGVQRDDRLLLAKNGRFRGGMYSIIAGFVEPGESLEQTVRREIREEVSLEVKNIRYFGSQPWPFPDSLMLGFTAEYASGEINVDGEEIVDAGWYKADSFPQIPPHGSISRRIIDEFLSRTSMCSPTS